MAPRRLRRARTARACLLAACAPILAVAACTGRAVPDILVVSIDTLRADHLGCYGYTRPTSPVIDGIAARGVLMRNTISTTSWTLPAHAAMFTGLYDTTHAAIDNDRALADAHVTLAEVLAGAGYRTAGFYGGPFLHPTFGLHQGFEVWQSCMTRLAADLPDAAIREESRAPRAAAHADITGPRTVEEVGRWIASLDDRPFFLFVHLWDVHYDYIAPREYVDLFDPGYDGPVTGVDFMHDPAMRPGLPDRDFRHLIALYDAEIRFTDTMLGKILDALDRRGRLDDTIVVITADHGEEFFEHGGKGHSRTLFDEVLRVPLIVSWPGRLPEGLIVEDQVRLIDLMPTILSLAGVDHDVAMQGRDLSPLLRGRPLEAAFALSELHVDALALRSLRSLTFKTMDAGGGRPSWGYDLTRDPAERQPIPAAHPEVRAGSALMAREVGRAVAFRDRIGHDAPAIELDPEMRERLRSLGYIGDDGGP